MFSRYTLKEFAVMAVLTAITGMGMGAGYHFVETMSGELVPYADVEQIANLICLKKSQD